MIKLYDLAAKNTEVRFSPYILAGKDSIFTTRGIEFDTIPCHFTEKEKLPVPNEGKVPFNNNGKDVVNDSWKIVQYRANLFEQCSFRICNHLQFIRNWAEYFLHPGKWKSHHS